MKICAAQIQPVKGDIDANIEKHTQLIELAIANRAAMIIFPELSITGYEPTLAKALATDQNDSRFDIFQQISNHRKIIITVGIPLKSSDNPMIGMLIFQPNQPRRVYTKQYLHADEDPYFACGNEQVYLSYNNKKLALAICYELSVQEHAANVYENGADVYVVSTAKTAAGMEKAHERLSQVAQQYTIPVIVSNCIGRCDGEECGGRSAAWNSKGELTGQLDDSKEGILILNTDTMELTKRTI